MKRFTSLFLLIILTFVACSEDDTNPTDDMSGEETGGEETDEITNGFIFNEEKYPTPIVTKTNYDNHYQLTFVNEDFSAAEYSGTINFVGVLFQSVDGQIIPGTYTFLLDTDPNYDQAKNFFDAESGAGLKITNGEADLSSGYYEKLLSGTVSIAKENTTYTITYSIEYQDGTFEGNYTGEIINSEEIIPQPSLLGKWELMEYRENGVVEEVQCPNNDTLEFFENNEAIITVYREGRLDEMGEVFRVCVDTPQPDTVIWSRNENIITFDFGGGDTEEGEITEFTTSRLVLTYTYEDEGATFQDVEVYQKVETN